MGTTEQHPFPAGVQAQPLLQLVPCTRVSVTAQLALRCLFVLWVVISLLKVAPGRVWQSCLGPGGREAVGSLREKTHVSAEHPSGTSAAAGAGFTVKEPTICTKYGVTTQKRTENRLGAHLMMTGDRRLAPSQLERECQLLFHHLEDRGCASPALGLNSEACQP